MFRTPINYLLFLIIFSTAVDPPVRADTSPGLNNGKKWRIGYYEGGPYSDYTDTMRTLVKGLVELGWITGEKPPELHGEMPMPYIAWLSKCSSPYLSFSTGDAYSAGWDGEKRRQIRTGLLARLTSGALDLVIAMGTWAGQDLAVDSHFVPVMVLSTSDPVGAGIIKSAADSGRDHVTARVDPNRYLRQIRMFHRITGFKTLGLAYENTPDGLIYAAMKEVTQVAGERGFTVVPCEFPDTTTDLATSEDACLACFRELAQKADAIYVTALTCADRRITDIVRILREAKTPSFSLVGSKLVKKGIMLSISSDSGYQELGRYNAAKFAKILNGISPRSLPQLFEDPLDIAVNMETVRQTGFVMPKSILKIAAEIYED